MGPGEFALMLGAGGLGFVLADGLDRMLATFDPSSADPRPKDKFTSDGTGSLANTLNIAARPGIGRLAAGVGLTAAPAVGAYFVKNSYARGALEGLAVGAGINLFKTLWNNLLMPMLVGKDTTASPELLKKSYIARLYPAEVAAYINLQAQKGADGKMAPGPYPAAGVLSEGPADVGPFALAGDSPYPSASEVLRHQAGVQGDSPYPTAEQALRAGVSGDSPYPSAADALRRQSGVSAWQPGLPTGPGPGPQAEPHTDPSCGCVGENNPFLGFIGEETAA